MRRLTKEERLEIEEFLVKGNRNKKEGYIVLRFKENKKLKVMKRSRAYFQLIYGLKLNKDEIIHHIDGNKENDDIRNLELGDINTHTSNYHSSRRKKFKGKCAK